MKAMPCHLVASKLLVTSFDVPFPSNTQRRDEEPGILDRPRGTCYKV
ncbi:MAG: hypothetical protein NUW12_11085 [Firmicutes bacterium]|nr:hypothetical protein [Bacillota bacterium]MDH7496559.1 hypothetical protein [Bacillota bacterium]